MKKTLLTLLTIIGVFTVLTINVNIENEQSYFPGSFNPFRVSLASPEGPGIYANVYPTSVMEEEREYPDDYSNYPPTVCANYIYVYHWYYECTGYGSLQCNDSENWEWGGEYQDCWEI